MMFTKLKLTFATAVVLIGGAAGFAAAQGPRHDWHQMKQQFDLDHNGTLDDAERATMRAAFGAKRAERRAKVLATFDTNRNGGLDPAEKQAMHDQRATARFTSLDTNNDGRLTLDEFKAAKHGHGMRHGRRGGGRGRF